MDYTTKYIIALMSIQIDSLIDIILEKNICTKEELNKIIEQKEIEKYPNLEKFEILSNIEKISKLETPLSEKDEKYLREKGIEVDSEENIKTLIESLKMKDQFKNLFGGLYK